MNKSYFIGLKQIFEYYCHYLSHKINDILYMKNGNKSTDFFNSGNMITLLKTFSKPDMREFENFVLSPFHNNRSEVTRFFQAIKGYHPGFCGKGFSKEEIFEKVYPGKKYRDDIVRRLSSNLFKLAENFIAHRSLMNDRFRLEMPILEYYYSTFTDKLYSKHFKELTSYVENQPLRSSEYFKNISLLEETNRSFLLKSDPTAKMVDMDKETESYLTHSLIKILRLYGVMISANKQYNKKYHLKYLEPLMKIAEDSAFMNSKAMEMIWLSIKLETNERNNGTFFKIKELIESNFSLLDTEERVKIYNALLSYCYDMKITPGKDLDKEEFQLLKQMLDQGFLIVGNTMYSEWFMYAFLSAVRSGETEFAEKFVEDYKSLLPDDERSNIVNTAYAELAIEKKDFDKALKLIALPKYQSVNEKLRLNQMYMKIYYEMGKSEEFFFQADRFKHLLRNERSVSKGVGIIARENFVKFIIKLYKIKIGESDLPLDLLKKEMSESKILGVKWLVEKLGELDNSIKN